MLKINIGSSFDQSEIVFDDNTTVRKAFETAKINLNNSMTVMVNSRRIPTDDLDKTLSQVGIKDGDLVTTSQKIEGAN